MVTMYLHDFAVQVHVSTTICISLMQCKKASTPFASRPRRQQHQVDLKDWVTMGEARDDIILALRVQVDPVLLHNAVLLAQGIAQHLGSVSEAGIGRELNGCELVTGGVHSTDCHLQTDKDEGCISRELNGCELIAGWVYSTDRHLHTDKDASLYKEQGSVIKVFDGATQ